MWPRLNNTTPIAVDVGMTSLRAIQLARSNGTFTVRHWANQSYPTEVSEGQEACPKEVTVALQHAKLAGHDLFVGRKIVTALGPPDVEVCSLHVPQKILSQEKEAIVRSIRHEVARHVSIPVDTAELDAWPLPAGQNEGPNVMVAAVSRTTIKDLLDWIDAQGCLCTRIDLAPLAIMRAVTRIMSDIPTDRLWGVLDIGLRSSRFYLGLGETPVYVRNMRAGGDLMTRRIVNELNVDLAMAERFKRHYGIRAEPGGYRPMLAEQGPVDDKRMAGILLGILTPIIRGMAHDIERSFRYAMDLYPNRSVSDLILVGGGCSLEGLPELLQSLLGIRVRRVSADRLAQAGRHHPVLAENVLTRLVTCLGLSYGESQP